MDGSHPCPGPGEVHAGDGQVPDDMLACSRHWYQVDAATRSLVYREWRSRPHSPEHLRACHDAVAQMSELPPPKARAGR